MIKGLNDRVTTYWNENIHDLAMVNHEIGTKEFFEDLEDYRFDKNRYLPNVVDFSGYSGQKLLEIGCGVGLDLVRFAKGGAIVMGIDLSERAIGLAKKNIELNGLEADLRVMDGQNLELDDDSFDVVYVHGVLPYTVEVEQMVMEIYRVLKPGGEAILQAYNKRSWFYAASKLMKVKLEHEDAPAFQIHLPREMKHITRSFSSTEVIYERFPVKTRLHSGLKAKLYNLLFVGVFNAIPRPLVRRFGWHLIVKAVK